MTTRRITDLPRATEIPTDDNVPVCFEDKQINEFRYTTIGEIRHKSIYTHRNGETETPMAEGTYWFRGEIDGCQFAHIVVVSNYNGNIWMAYGDTGSTREDMEIAYFVGQWWGPIVAPCEVDGMKTSKL